MDMSCYKMIYQDQVYNVISITLDFGGMDVSHKKPKFINAVYLDDCGEIALINDEAWMFKFVRR